MESLKAYIIFSLKASFDEFIGLRPELVRALRDLAEPLFSKALSYSRPSEPACSKQVFWFPSRFLSLRSAHSPHARARKTSATTSVGFTGPIPATACFSPRSVLTLALADSQRGLGLNDLLSLPLALRGSSGGHRCPQEQDGQQQQQPGPRIPEHLQTVRQLATKFGSLRNLRAESLSVPPRR